MKEKIVEKRVEVPMPPPPLPSSPSLGARGGDLNAMFSGIGLKTTLIPSLGETASEERASETSYVVELVLKVNVPKPASTLNQLLPMNPALGKLLPQLEPMIGKGKVSGFFHYLYELKEKAVAANLKRLDRLPTRHNFYDMDTMLELEHAPTSQKVLLMKGMLRRLSEAAIESTPL